MTSRTAFLAISVAVAMFVVGSLILLNTDASPQLVGVLYLLGGSTVMVCARFVAQQAIAPNLPAFLAPVFGVRPRTLVLWGGGIALIGLLMTIGVLK